MKKTFTAVGGILLSAVLAAAADVPRMETFLGYTYVRTNTATDVPAFSSNGGSGQFAYNFNKWLGAVADIGAVHNGAIGNAIVDNTTTNFLFGPRVSLRFARVRPYFQVLWGGAYLAASTQVDITPVLPSPLGILGLPEIPGQPITARLVTSQTAFAMTAGGGVDIKINKHVSFRPIGLDYYLTRFQNLRTQGDNNQNDIRYTTGFNFTFGAQ
ncbi:MAG: outer membrane beta-barrel protein [Bryobacteraceae bacterium]|jgi:opacity protein-like surface antigen